jgi:NDP-sugar pyrophosphorylase family protein
LDVIITLAGKSKRFLHENYNKIKYLLPIGRSTVIQQVLNLFSDSDYFHLIISKKQLQDNPYLKKYLKELKKNIFLYVINDHDNGPVFSVLEAKITNIKNNFIICYNDLLVDWDYKKFKRLCFSYDGGIVSFSGFQPSLFTGTLYCYLKTKNNEVVYLREKNSFTKNPASEIVSAGIYYFSNFDKFINYSEKLFKKKKNYINNEIYVSQVYLPMLNDKKKILDFRVKNFISLGTPKDYRLFLSWKKYFEKND